MPSRKPKCSRPLNSPTRSSPQWVTISSTPRAVERRSRTAASSASGLSLATTTRMSASLSGPPTDQLAAAPVTAGSTGSPSTPDRPARPTMNGTSTKESVSVAPTSRRSPADEIATDCHVATRSGGAPPDGGAELAEQLVVTEHIGRRRDMIGHRAQPATCSADMSHAKEHVCLVGLRERHDTVALDVGQFEDRLSRRRDASHPLSHGAAALVIEPWRVATPTSFTVTASATWPPNRTDWPPMRMSPTLNGRPPDFSPGGTSNTARTLLPARPRTTLK